MGKTTSRSDISAKVLRLKTHFPLSSSPELRESEQQRYVEVILLSSSRILRSHLYPFGQCCISFLRVPGFRRHRFFRLSMALLQTGPSEIDQKLRA